MIQTPNRNRFSYLLILAALLLFFPLLSCGGSKSPIEQAANTVCQKLAQCALISSGDVGACTQEGKPVVSMLPDPDGFMTCIKQQSCDTLANDATAEQAVTDCLNIDMSSVKCNGDQKTIHLCANNGVCRDWSCSEVCSEGFDGASYMYCGYESDRGHDVCYCQ
jgi:hypothetical protein